MTITGSTGITLPSPSQNPGPGGSANQGTWVHPRVATNLAQWISPKYDVLVSGIMDRYHRGDLTLAAEVVQQHDAVHGTESHVTIVTKRKAEIELEEMEERVRRMRKENDRMEIDTLLHARRSHMELASWALERRDTFQWDERELAFLRDRTLNALTFGEPEKKAAEARLWTVVFRASHLGIRVSGDDEARLGMAVSRAFQKHYCRKPQKIVQAFTSKKDTSTQISVNGYTTQECEEVVDDVIRSFASRSSASAN